MELEAVLWICFRASRGKGIFVKEFFSTFFFDRKNEKYFSENGEKNILVRISKFLKFSSIKFFL